MEARLVERIPPLQGHLHRVHTLHPAPHEGAGGIDDVDSPNPNSTIHVDAVPIDAEFHVSLILPKRRDRARPILSHDEGPETVYMIAPDQHLAAAYYRNTIVHYFVNEAIIELAVLHVAEQDADDPVEAFWDEAFRLRDLLKFEFFFAEKDAFRDELREELAVVNPDWESQLRTGDVRPILEELRPFMAHRALRPFLEAYQVVADRLQICDPHKPFNEPIFVPGCLGLGSQYLLQRHIKSGSSVSKALFETALKLARNRGLLDGDGDVLARERAVFGEEIHDALRRVDAIEALAASRRAGLIP